MQKNSSRKTVKQMESVGSSNKKHKANEDIISNLPDSLITYILSCVPTKDAARTSVLSKRWIDCWTFVTKVNLDDSMFFKHKKKKSGGKRYFINFVNRALHLTKSNTAESFSLVITNKYDISLLNTWISGILKRNVKKLSITTYLELPFSAYTSHILFNYSYKLEELVLEMRCCSIKVPPCSSYDTCSFGSLNVIKLCGIMFTMDESLGILFRTLKKFEMKNCSWLSTDDVTLELNAPLLESVLINQQFRSVNRETRSCKIKFSASCMKEFTYRGYGMSQAIILSDPSAARNASAKITLDKEYGNSVQETQSCASLLLKQFSQVKCIQFYGLEVTIISFY
ncbi:putative F-box domain-containing protein [Medicago truncatula]|uniref:Putative F-box domain-containing protein n=1 Tax=Medicago truncatula TaxID=3880 RepID=A0A396JCJ3_MEDTR|nr:putative F-box domain-containing protein [Medicago truncatula]